MLNYRDCSMEDFNKVLEEKNIEKWKNKTETRWFLLKHC